MRSHVPSLSRLLKKNLPESRFGQIELPEYLDKSNDNITQSRRMSKSFAPVRPRRFPQRGHCLCARRSRTMREPDVRDKRQISNNNTHCGTTMPRFCLRRTKYKMPPTNRAMPVKQMPSAIASNRLLLSQSASKNGARPRPRPIIRREYGARYRKTTMRPTRAARRTHTAHRPAR